MSVFQSFWKSAKNFLLHAWKESKYNALFFVLSGTYLRASYRKFKLGENRAAVGALIRRLNGRHLAIAVGIWFLLFVLELLSPRSLEGSPFAVFSGLALYYFFSRVNEIFLAFLRDSHSHLGPNAKARSDISYADRIPLAMKSYLEMILDYGLIYFLLQPFAGMFSSKICLIQCTYFSAVTITTLGYGDITPGHWLSQFLTVYEVLNGFALIIISFTIYVSKSINESKGVG